MPRLSNVLLRNVLSKTDCRILGLIQYAYFDENCKKIVYFVCKRTDGELFALPFSSLLSVADAVVVENCLSALSLNDLDSTSFVVNIAGKEVYNADGINKGQVDDVIYDDKGKVKCFTIGENEYSPSKISGVGDVVMLKVDAKPRAKKKPKMPTAFEDRAVFALNHVSAEARAEDIPQLHVEKPPATTDKMGVPVLLSEVLKGLDISPVSADHTPPRIIADYNFLLGRTLVKDLVSYSGTVLAHENTFVTADTVELARRNGKLVDLTLNSK